MEKAQAAVSKFMNKAGHHDTTVHENVAPAVTKETVKPHQHENITTAVDKEVHQDHHHTAVQPVKDQQVLPEQHHHNIAATEKREFHHGKDEQVKQTLAQTAGQFRDESRTAQTKETRQVNPTVAGEHVHHHVHETIQPVVERETIQPHVVHTTVPIHEVHHNEPKHHQVTSLPAVSMGQFKNAEGGLSGRGEHTDRFDGEPRTIGSGTDHHHQHGQHDQHGQHGSGLGSHSGTGVGSGIGSGQHSTGSGIGSGVAGGMSTGVGHSSGMTSGTGMTGGQHAGSAHNTGLGSHQGQGLRDDPSHNTHVGEHAKHGTEHGAHDSKHSTGKPSLMDKLNPKIDADGDGKKGFMS